MNRSLLSVAAVSLFELGLAAAVSAQVVAPQPCPPPQAGKTYSNVPYVATDCWTTPYGPAAADVVRVAGDLPPYKSPNMLRCSKGPYALCFYSGPPEKTGKNANNNNLPCKVDASGKFADCTCQYYSDGENYVDMNGILSLGVWQQTVAQCGEQGKGCANITNIVDCWAEPAAPFCQEAAVCGYIRDQAAGNAAVSLVPGADTISDFGFAMAKDYEATKTTSCPKGRYAGCMTAACKFPGGKAPADGGTVQCNCPIYEGVFQVGQVRPDLKPYSCDLGGGYVWSGSNTVNIIPSP